MAKPVPLSVEVSKFVVFHLADRSAFAPFTGADFPAWHAFLHLIELWGRTRDPSVIIAMKTVLQVAQWRNQDVMAVFKKSIPAILDWVDEPVLWKQIAPEAPPSDILRDFAATVSAQGMTARRIIWPCGDGARVCSHLNSKPSKKNAGWLVCTDKTCKAEWRREEGATGALIVGHEEGTS